jgi:hypothetical protein
MGMRGDKKRKETGGHRRYIGGLLLDMMGGGRTSLQIVVEGTHLHVPLGKNE